MKTTGLTLAEAVASGRKFRHAHFGSGNGSWIDVFGWKNNPPIISLEKLISSDWEIQVKETFTREDVMRAVNKAKEYLASHWDKEAVGDHCMKAAENE